MLSQLTRSLCSCWIEWLTVIIVMFTPHPVLTQHVCFLWWIEPFKIDDRCRCIFPLLCFCKQPKMALYLTCSSLSLSLSPSVFVWKEERGAASLIGEGRRPRCESWGSHRSRASTFNLSDIIKARLADWQPHRGTRENTLYWIFSLCLSPSSAPFFFSLWNLIFSNTASSFLFISWRYSLSL